MRRIICIAAVLLCACGPMGANPNLAATSNALYGYSTPYYQPAPYYYQRPPMYVGGYQTRCTQMPSFNGPVWTCRQI